MSPLPKGTLLIYGGLALLGVVAIGAIVKGGARAGQALGQGVGGFVGGAAVGTVYGLGGTVGLPNTSDANVQAAGKAALDSGRYIEASAKLPALDFLNGVGSKFGIWLYNTTHTDELARDATAGVGSNVNGLP